jgi:hypothetical protein
MYKVEVLQNGQWQANPKQFPTPEEANLFGFKLCLRWNIEGWLWRVVAVDANTGALKLLWDESESAARWFEAASPFVTPDGRFVTPVKSLHELVDKIEKQGAAAAARDQ